MKNYKTYIMLLLTLTLISCSSTTKKHKERVVIQNSNTHTMRPCTKEYLPICAEVAIECITTPCEPIKQTFSNACVLSNNKKATFLYKGACKK